MLSLLQNSKPERVKYGDKEEAAMWLFQLFSKTLGKATLTHWLFLGDETL